MQCDDEIGIMILCGGGDTPRKGGHFKDRLDLWMKVYPLDRQREFQRRCGGNAGMLYNRLVDHDTWMK